jgi:hypothetical protein
MAVKGRNQPTQKEKRAEKKRITEARTTPLIECGICLEGIPKQEHFKLPCAHVYHEKCFLNGVVRTHRVVLSMGLRLWEGAETLYETEKAQICLHVRRVE